MVVTVVVDVIVAIVAIVVIVIVVVTVPAVAVVADDVGAHHLQLKARSVIRGDGRGWRTPKC